MIKYSIEYFQKLLEDLKVEKKRILSEMKNEDLSNTGWDILDKELADVITDINTIQTVITNMKLLVEGCEVFDFHTIPFAGTEGGHCKKDCNHVKCAELRKIAQTPCKICGQSIGYAFGNEYRKEEDNSLVHLHCLMNEVEKKFEETQNAKQNIELDKIEETLNVIDLVQYQEKEDGKWKIGLRMNNGNLGIIGIDGKEIGECWDYKEINSFRIDLSSIIEKEQEILKYYSLY